MRARWLAGMALAVAMAAACSSWRATGEPSPSPTPAPDPAAVGVEVVAACDDDGSPRVVEVAAGPTPTTVGAVAFPCAAQVVVADRPGQLVQVVAAGLAARLGLPFFPDAESAASTELATIVVTDHRASPTPQPGTRPGATPGRTRSPATDPTSVTLTGPTPTALAAAVARRTHDRRAVLLGPADELLVGLREVAAHGGILLPWDGSDELVGDLRQAGFEVATVSPQPAPAVTPPSSASPHAAPPAAVAAPGFPQPGTDLWLVEEDTDLERPWLDVAAAVTRAQRVLAVADDPRTHRPLQQLIDELGDGLVNIRRSATIAAWDPWQLDVVLGGTQLPGGGYTIFPARRIVALYGHPNFAGLGVLGEQGPADAVARAMEVAAPYAEGDVPVVAGFDLITTLASAGPTGDGDYSEPLDPDVVRPWVEAAGEAGMYVLLDFQPGRSSFMDQVPMYEEFLLLPHVGVALDPEWRLRPNQVHLRQVGSVSATEINDVAGYLAGLVRKHALPQKLLVVHQFRLSMIRDRDVLEHPAELAVLIHMDGQGPIDTKGETYRAITTGFEDRVWWGWKNFYDEDSPTPSPEHTMSQSPSPLFVSYQ